MKKSRLLIWAAVLVLCTACYVLLGKKSSSAETTDSEETDEETVLAVPSDTITGFSFVVGKNTYSFLKNDDTWNYSGDPNFPADADKIENLLSAFSEVSASRVLTDVSDLAQYGLEKPANTIHLTDSEGGEYVLHIGNLNSSTGDYYAYTSDEKTVYTIDSTIPLDFQIGLYDLAKTESFPSIDSTEVSLVEVTSENGLFSAYQDASSNTGWLLSDGSRVYEGDDSKLLSLLDELGSISYQSCLEYDCQNPEAYGLDHPIARIRVRYTEVSANTSVASSEDPSASGENGDAAGGNSEDGENPAAEETTTGDAAGTEVVFLIGIQDESGRYFIQREGTGEVHTVLASALADFLDVDVTSYRSLALAPLSMEQVASLTLTYEGKQYTFEQQETTAQNDGGEDVTSYTCTRNGKTFDADTYQDFFKTARGMNAQSYTDAFPDTDAVCVIQFAQTDGSGRTVSYYPYDDNFYLALVSDDGQDSADAALVNKMDVSTLLAQVQNVIK